MSKKDFGNRYKRAAVSEVSGIRLLDGVPVIEGKVIRQKDAKRGSIFDNLFFLLAKVIKVENSVGGELVLEAVPIVTPNCDLVVPSLSLTVIFIFIVSLHLHCNNRWCRASMC